MIKKLIIGIFILPLFLFSKEARTVIESVDRTLISSEIGGNIVFIPKNNGDYFKKGETLVKIDCDVYKAQSDKIRVKRSLASTKVNKNKQLAQYNTVGKFEIETSKLELQEQDMELRIANINVKRCEIKAPFSGRIVQKLVSKYQNVKPQDQLIEIVNSDNLEAKVVIPANWINEFKVNDQFEIKIDEINEIVKAKIIQFDSVVDSKSQTINIRASIEKNEKIIPGMSGTALFK